MSIQSTCDDILVLAENGICTITFNRVAKKNSITGAMYLAMASVLQQAATSGEVRVVLFQGDATVFTAGNDLGDFLNGPKPDENAPPFQFLQALAACPKPIVAAVCGPAVGIGTTMLLHCDLVYAGDNAMFSLPFVNLGFCPEGASSLLLPQLMGHQRASEALLLGDPFMAEAALEVGLVNRVVPPTECNTIAQAQAAKLAAKPLGSLLASKKLLKSGQMAAVQARIAEEGKLFADLLQQPAAKEAMSAFLEKRKPDFSKC